MEDIQRILKQFYHGRARLLHFTASHDRLVLQLTSSNEQVETYLIFVGCNEISLPVLYEIHDPIIEKTGRQDEFQYVDKNVRILFRECYIDDSYHR